MFRSRSTAIGARLEVAAPGPQTQAARRATRCGSGIAEFQMASREHHDGGDQMAYLARRENPFEELFDFRRDFDDIFNRFMTGAERPTGMLGSAPPIEAWVDSKEKKYHLRIALPGVDPNEVQLNLQGNYLTLSGKHKSTEAKKDV